MLGQKEGEIRQGAVSALKAADFYLYGHISSISKIDAFAYDMLRQSYAPGGVDEGLTSYKARLVFFLWADFVNWNQGKEGEKEALFILWTLDRKDKIEEAAAKFLESGFPKFLEPGPDVQALKRAGYGPAVISLFAKLEKEAPSRISHTATKAARFLSEAIGVDAAKNLLEKQTPGTLMEFLSAAVFFAVPVGRVPGLTELSLAAVKSIGRHYSRWVPEMIESLIARECSAKLPEKELKAIIEAVVKSSQAKASSLKMPVLDSNLKLSGEFARLLESEVIVQLRIRNMLTGMFSDINVNSNLIRKRLLALPRHKITERALLTVFNSLKSHMPLAYDLARIIAEKKFSRAELFSAFEKVRASHPGVISYTKTRGGGSHMQVNMDLGDGLQDFKIVISGENAKDETAKRVVAALYAAGLTPKEIAALFL